MSYVVIEIKSPEEMNIFARRLADIRGSKLISFGFPIDHDYHSFYQGGEDRSTNKLPALFKLEIMDENIVVSAENIEKIKDSIMELGEKSCYFDWEDKIHSQETGLWLIEAELDVVKILKNTKKKPNENSKRTTHNTDGGSTNYYDITECKDVDDICEHLDLSFFEGNILKALFGRALARKGSTRHKGTSLDRDTKKVQHYARKLNGKS